MPTISNGDVAVPWKRGRRCCTQF